jgi:hypothetical protein
LRKPRHFFVSSCIPLALDDRGATW